MTHWGACFCGAVTIETSGEPERLQLVGALEMNFRR